MLISVWENKEGRSVACQFVLHYSACSAIVGVLEGYLLSEGEHVLTCKIHANHSLNCSYISSTSMCTSFNVHLVTRICICMYTVCICWHMWRGLNLQQHILAQLHTYRHLDKYDHIKVKCTLVCIAIYFLYLMKTFRVETLHYYNLLCYMKCSTSLLTFKAIATRASTTSSN